MTMKLILAAALLAGSTGLAAADSSYTAESAWGTGVPAGNASSAVMHATYGVNAARVQAGSNVTPNNVSNYSIGSQTIVSVNGNGNTVQDNLLSSTNSGQVNNQGQISAGDGGDNTLGFSAH